MLRKAIGSMLHWIVMDEEFPDERWDWGVKLFDALTIEQKIAMLADVSGSLFDPITPAPKLTAVNEATIAAMFAAVRSEIQVEIDEDGMRAVERTDWHPWRRSVLAALREDDGEIMPSDDEEPLTVDCDDPDRWDCAIEALESGILWDDDWNMEDQFMDADPALSEVLKARLTIDDDYFTSPALDPTPQQLAEAKRKLREIVRPEQG